MKTQNIPLLDDSVDLLKLSDVMRQTRLGHTFIYRAMNQGTFPKQLKITKRCVRWRKSDILAWINKQSSL